MLNTNILEAAMKAAKMSKTQLCEETRIARTTLNAILAGSDARVSTIEAIAKALKIPVGVLFEPDDKDGVKTSGDFSPASYSGNVSVFAGGDALLAEKVSSLQAQVNALRDSLADKDRIIRLLDR